MSPGNDLAIPFRCRSCSARVPVGSNSKVLASCDVSGKLILWDLSDGSSTEHTLGPLNGEQLTYVRFSDDGILACGGGMRHRGGFVRLYRLIASELELVKGFRLDDIVRCLDFAPSGKLLAVGDYTSKATLIEISTEQSWRLDAGHSVSRVEFTPSGSTLGTTAGTQVKLWHVDSKEEIATINSGEELEGIGFVSSGMITASEEGPLRLWTIANEEDAVILLE